MLGNPQVLHAAALAEVSRQPVTERVLWRLEHDSRYRASVLVLTGSKPSWEHLVEQAGWPSADEPQALVRPYAPLLDRVARGREFAFRLRANPVAATRTPAKPSPGQQRHLASAPRPRGVRMPHRTAAHQMAWFTDRVGRWGFEIVPTAARFPDLWLAAHDRVVFTKSDDHGDRRRVVLQTATFEGRLRVVDPDLARTSLLSGVGPARAYGCRLITLAAPRPAAGG